MFGNGLFSSLGRWQHRNERPAFQALVEFHVSNDGCKDCVIFAHADIFTRPPFRTALAADDIARNDVLATELLDAETASRTVATVA